MADTAPRIIQAEPAQVIGQKRRERRFPIPSWPPAWHQLALAGITLISIFMDFFQLGQNGFGSYYPPAVRSMMDNRKIALAAALCLHRRHWLQYQDA
jgi:hypothetical protein